MPSSVWSDLQAITDFLFDYCLGPIVRLCFNSILVFIFGFLVIRLVVKFFKRLVG